MKIEKYEVLLHDDGTLDTVLTVDGCRHAFDQEYAAVYRNPKTGAMTNAGFKELAKEAIEDHETNCVEIAE